MFVDPRVDELMDELLESGGSPEEVCRACPELLPQVRAGLQRLRRVEHDVGVLFPPSGPRGGVRLGALPTAELPNIPGYEVQEELGRGGVGVVYRTHHLRLDRTVALKMLLAGPFARTQERARFLREAQALAALRHPNIVQIYEFGELDGLPYFAMEYVEGGSLAQRLAGTPLPPREAAALAAMLAEAVEAAHRSGIVHRDLKPANVLLTAAGMPKVTDFGLARRLDGGGGATLTGTALGTPSYMAPEQARGSAAEVGPATDVYALGAVLYELLTGRPPFRAETPTETVHQVIYQDPAPPSRLNARVPRDMETICLKCLEKEPRRRYPTARALADDLHAWLEGRPMVARRVGVAERAWLWCRRKPAIAALAAAVALAVVGGTAATIAVQATANRRLDRKNAELSDALGREAKANAELSDALGREAKANGELNDANSRVEARYDLAVQAIKTLHTGVSKDFLLQQEQFQELRDQLLKSAADFYGRLSALLGQEASPASRRALAAANFELASLTGMVGRTEAALAAHRAVLAAREALAAEPGAGAAARADIGRSLTEVAQLLEATGRTGEALATCRRAEALLAGAADSDPAARAALAACRSRLGNLLSRTGQAADALATYLRARADQEALAAAPGAPTEARRDLVDTMTRIGHLLSDTGRRSEAEAEYRRALEIQEKLAAENPAVTEFRSRLAGTHHNLGLLLARTGPPTEAEAEYRRALEICGKLAADHPAVTEFRSLLAATHHNLGLLLARTGPPTEAEAEYRRALEICGKLAADHPAVTKFRSLLANSHHNLGLLLEQTGRPTEAEPEYRRTLELRRKLAAENPAVTEFRSRLAATHHNLGLLLARTGPPTEAEAEYRRALEICGKLAAENPAGTEFRSLLAASHHNLGLVLAQTGRPREAEAEYRRALEIQEKLAAEKPAVTEFRSRLAATHNDLGNLLAQTGRPTEAEGEHRRALEIREKLAAGNPKVPGYRDDVASCHTNLSVILRRLGRPAEARDGCDRAIAIREALAKEVPTVPMYRSHLARSCRRRGLARRDLGDFAGAAADARRALALWDSLPSRTGEEWFETACARAALAGLAGRDGSGTSAAEAASEAETAMALLHKAVAMGYRSLDAFRTEDALDPFRDRPDFRLLMMDLAMPADPFARSD